MKKPALLLLCLTSLSGCATMFDGKTQAITVNTSPPKADCVLSRQGSAIGEIRDTPSSVVIEKSRDDITLACNKLGYQQATYLDHSGLATWTFANILFGGIIGGGIDFATGAINKYDTPVNVTLAPEQAK